MDEACVFCQIAEVSREVVIIYEDDRILAFLDQKPLTEHGHTLIIPRVHSASLLEAEMTDLVALMVGMQTVAQILESSTGCDGINILTNIGRAAGQEVMHTHIHLIPRFQGDEVLELPTKPIFPDLNLTDLGRIIQAYCSPPDLT